MLADFPYFDLLHSVLGSRAAVTPVQLLDSATAEAEGKLKLPTTSGPSASSLQDTPGPSASSHQDCPGPSTGSWPTSHGPSTSSRPTNPGPATSIRPTFPCPVDDNIPVPNKKRKRLTNIQRAEKAATSW